MFSIRLDMGQFFAVFVQQRFSSSFPKKWTLNTIFDGSGTKLASSNILEEGKSVLPKLWKLMANHMSSMAFLLESNAALGLALHVVNLTDEPQEPFPPKPQSRTLFKRFVCCVCFTWYTLQRLHIYWICTVANKNRFFRAKTSLKWKAFSFYWLGYSRIFWSLYF